MIKRGRGARHENMNDFRPFDPIVTIINAKAHHKILNPFPDGYDVIYRRPQNG